MSQPRKDAESAGDRNPHTRHPALGGSGNIHCNWAFTISSETAGSDPLTVIETIQIAGAIAMAVFPDDSMFQDGGARKKGVKRLEVL